MEGEWERGHKPHCLSFFKKPQKITATNCFQLSKICLGNGMGYTGRRFFANLFTPLMVECFYNQTQTGPRVEDPKLK